MERLMNSRDGTNKSTAIGDKQRFSYGRIKL